MTSPTTPTPGPSHTWSCTDCPAWAGRYWDTPDEAASDPKADEHKIQCPGQGRIVIVGRPAGGTSENLGAEQRIGNYDPNEPLLVPYWAVLAARGLAGIICKQAEQAQRVDFADPVWAQLVGGAVLAANPLPDAPKPQDAQQLADLLRRLTDTLVTALPHL